MCNYNNKSQIAKSQHIVDAFRDYLQFVLFVIELIFCLFLFRHV